MATNSSLKKKGENNKKATTDTVPENRRVEKDYSNPFNLTGIDFLTQKYILNKDKEIDGRTASDSDMPDLSLIIDRSITPPGDNSKYQQLLDWTSVFNPDPVESPLKRKDLSPEMDYVHKNGRFNMDRVKTAVEKSKAEAKAQREERERMRRFIDLTINDIRKKIPEDSNYFTNAEGRDNSTTKDILYDTEKIINASQSRQKDGAWKQFGKSFVDEITDSETYTFGAKELDNLARINRILDKLEENKKLTAPEQNLLNAAAARQAAEDLYSTKKNLVQDIGSVTAQAIPVVAEGLVVGGISQAAKTATKVWMKKRLSNYIAKKVAAGGSRGTIASHIPDAAAHVAEAAVETVLSPDTYNNALNDHVGTAQYTADDETQGIKYKGQTDRKGLGESLLESGARSLAENTFEGSSKLATKNKLGKNKKIEKLHIDDIIYGATDEIIPNTISKVVNGNNPEFTISDGVLPVINSIYNVAGKAAGKKIASRVNDKRINMHLEKAFGKDEADRIKKKISGMTPAEINRYQAKITDKNNTVLTHKQKTTLHTILEIDKTKKEHHADEEEALYTLYNKLKLNDSKRIDPEQIQQIEVAPKSTVIPTELPGTLPLESDPNHDDKDAPANEESGRKRKEEKRRSKKRKKRSRNR